MYVFFLRKHAFERCCCLNIAKEVPEASLLAVETAIAPSRTGLSIADGGQEANIQMLSNRHHGIKRYAEKLRLHPFSEKGVTCNVFKKDR